MVNPYQNLNKPDDNCTANYAPRKLTSKVHINDKKWRVTNYFATQ